MNANNPARIRRGYEHLPSVNRHIAMLYRELGCDFISGASPIPPGKIPTVGAAVGIGADGSILDYADVVTRTFIEHLGLPDAKIDVSYRDMKNPGRVTFVPGQAYKVEIAESVPKVDYTAVLAHEILHVFLRRRRIVIAETFQNELLTDTATAYLGLGGLLLNAFRRDGDIVRQYGYLSPDELGYVINRRARDLDEPVIDQWLSSPLAAEALRGSRARVAANFATPPLAASPIGVQLKYQLNKKRNLRAHQKGITGISTWYEDRYRFELSSDSLKVILRCPVCLQQLRISVGQSVRIRCQGCRYIMACRT